MTGLLVVASALLCKSLSASIPLQKSLVHIQARILSDSTGTGLHSGDGSTGSSMLPSRILVGKHSRITDVSEFDFFQE